MKKYGIILGLVAVVLIAYLVVHNNQMKHDLNQAKDQVDHLNEYISESNKQTMNFESSDPAGSFIRNYFDFEDHPEKEDVESLVTNQAKEKLDFGEVSQSASDDQVKSEVESLDIYYGDATDNRQELFATFNNIITYNDQTSEKMSYIRMDMLKDGNEWKVDDFEFRQ